MATMSLPRRGMTLWIVIAIVIVLVYIPFNVIYILASAKQSNGGEGLVRSLMTDTKLKLNVKKSGELLKMEDFHLRNDGTVDLSINFNIADLLKVLNAYSDGSFNGEMTTNPLPVNFSYLLANEKVCGDVQKLEVLVYVHSAPGNSARRKIIRSTWAHNDLFTDFSMRRVFLMGRPKDKAEWDIVEAENKNHKDMVVGDFVDHYRNLTLKAIMGLKWAATFCHQARYVIKADDDAFVNIFEVRKIMKSQENQKEVLICPLWKENTMPILRDPSKCMKWCVRFNEFPGRSHFPKYCAGLTFIMSQHVVPQLYQASLTTPFFWIDDVYVSGMLAPKVKNLHYVDLLRNFTLKENLAAEEYMRPRTQKVSYYFAHVKTPAIFYKMWNATLHRLPPTELSKLGDYVFVDFPTLKKNSAR